MNILMFSRLFTPHLGGVEKHVEKLSRELIKKNHSVSIITENFDGKQLNHQKIGLLEIHRIPQISSTKFGIWQWFWQHRNLLQKADLIHAHDVFWWYLPFRFIYPKKPVYITFHGYEGWQPPSRRAIIHRKIAARLCRGSISIGGFMKKWYQSKSDYVLYGASDLSAVKAAPEPNSAIFIGRLAPDTGIMTYLKALAILKKQAINLKLEVYGDGPQIKAAKKLVSREKLNVNFHGFVKNAHLKMSHNVYAFVSRYLSILEAMQAKRLIIAVYNNQIKHDYLTCHPMSKNFFIAQGPEKVAEKIRETMEEKEKTEEMIKLCSSWAKQQTWDKIANIYLKLWQE